MTRIDRLGYPIAVGAGCRREVAALIEEQRAARVVVLSDARVLELARDVASAARKHARVALEAFALGERRKRLSTAAAVLQRLAAAGADRSTLVIGVGGGVASDLFGFAAAIYMRGVRYATVSTTLVGMADAAVGGKTGVDLPEGKNLAGVFRDPIAVFCDLDALATLPARGLREGLAEVVKAAIIAGGRPFEQLESLAAIPPGDWPWERVVSDAIRVKCDIVAGDREERGKREILNLGHTFGHAIEHASGYRVSHGSAVSVGLRGAGLLALATGRFSEAEHRRVIDLLTALRLPVGCEGLEAKALLKAMQSDKKTRNGELRFVLPAAIGSIEYGVAAPEREVRKVLSRLSARPRSRTSA